jgi:hypothetical protein
MMLTIDLGCICYGETSIKYMGKAEVSFGEM